MNLERTAGGRFAGAAADVLFGQYTVCGMPCTLRSCCASRPTEPASPSGALVHGSVARDGALQEWLQAAKPGAVTIAVERSRLMPLRRASLTML